MPSQANTPEEYIESLPEDRKKAVAELRKVILKNLPKGFSEVMSYGMIGYVVPHSMYPAGYQTNPKLPLPFINIGSQKSHLALHHLGLYGDAKLLEWFQKEWEKGSEKKLDMGKGCVRFKKMEDIPYAVIGKLASKISPKDWIKIYEEKLKKK